MSEFKKETRYVVLKLSKLTDHQKTALGAALAEINISAEAMPECVVVEHDWPNYAETWQSIQAIVEGGFVTRDALAAQVVDAFGDGYYDGFIDGAKHHEETDCNTDPAYIGDDAMRCSEIAESEKSKRIGIVSRQELISQVEVLRQHTNVVLLDRARKQMNTALAALSVMQSKAVYAYNCGYLAGHNDTVEGSYTDIHHIDKCSYNSDVVQDLIGPFCDESCLAQVRAEAVESAIKFCNHYMAFPVKRGNVADKVIAVDELIMYANRIRQGGGV